MRPAIGAVTREYVSCSFALSTALAAIVSLDTDPPDRHRIALVGQEYLLAAMTPVFAPLPQRQHDREQGFTLGAERIDDLAAIGRIRVAFEDSAVDQFGQPV